MKQYFIVIDTNVLVSGLISRNHSSPTIGILNCLLAEKDVIIPLYNTEIIKEYENVLNRDKFNIEHRLIDEVIERIIKIGIPCDRVESKENFPDQKDVVFYEVALSKDDSYLVTGNIKHFPKVDFVVTPAEMMEIIRNVE